MRYVIFCRVIDNYGDAGVCWRLATNLAQVEESVTLVIDRPDVLDALVDRHAMPASIQVLDWPDDQHLVSPDDIADVVIEAFACDPPTAYIEAMAKRAAAGRPPVWINLEYLSAEDWVGAHHRLPSPHPRHSLVKHFYFPGFTPDSGGLIREPSLFPLQEQTPPVAVSTLRIFLFSYEQPILEDWVALLDHTTLSVAPCPAADQLARLSDNLPATLTIRALPFVPQAQFDALLGEQDLLFVRGEDSFVRAQWAGKPVFWHIYPQDDGAHLEKLRAFYQRYLDPEILDQHARALILRFLLIWNRGLEPIALASLWPEIIRLLPALRKNAQKWRDILLEQPDLVTQLRAFVSDLVK